MHRPNGWVLGLVVAAMAVACGGTDNVTGPVASDVTLAAKSGTSFLPSAADPKVKTIVLCGQDYQPARCHGSWIVRSRGDEEGYFQYATFYVVTDRVVKGRDQFYYGWWVSGRDAPDVQLSPGVHRYAYTWMNSTTMYVEILIDPAAVAGPWAQEDGFGGIRDWGIFEGKTPFLGP